MSESVYLIREQGSGEPRVSRSALIGLKGVERPGSLSPRNANVTQINVHEACSKHSLRSLGSVEK